MIWIKPVRRLNKNDLNYHFEKVKIPFCDELINFITDNNNLYPDQSTQAVTDYKNLLVDYIEGLERDFVTLENMARYVSNQIIEIRKGVAKIDNIEYSLNYLNNEYSLVFVAGFDKKNNAYKYGQVTFTVGKKSNTILDLDIIFNQDPLSLHYNICDYFNDLFSRMNNASTLDELSALHKDAEKEILRVFRANTKYEIYEKIDDGFRNFYEIEPFVLLRDNYQFYIGNKIKLELVEKGFLNFNENHIELVRIDRILKSLLEERKEHIELMGEEIYISRCDKLMQEKEDLILKLNLAGRELNVLLD